MAKVGFISLGCPKNLIDSEVMIGLLQRQGHILTADPRQADVIVVNSCGFVADSKKESIQVVLEAAQLKNLGRCKRLILAGCLAERYPDEIACELSEVDVILGVNQIAEISNAVSGKPVPKPGSFGRADADLYLYDHSTARTLVGPRYSAYIKVSEGCHHTCSFCVIPRIRGRFRSRSLASLIEEARQLASRGVKEITLVSQDTTSYGTDLGLQDGLAQLLKALDEVEGLRWIRFLYAYPNMVGDKLIEAMNSSQRICNYIDMPLQHASAGILRSMRRGGSRASLTRMIHGIRKKIPDVTLRTTLIVGYPGETEEDFQELKSFCAEIEFDRLGVFRYSDEEDTTAHHLHPKVAARTAERRCRVLMRQQERIAARKNRGLVGKEFPVLVEGPAEETNLLLQGRLESQAPEIDGVCLINDSAADGLQIGEFRTVKITRALGHDLLGKIVR